jgi:hypothetical protein
MPILGSFGGAGVRGFRPGSEYSISPSTTSVNEGSSVTFTVRSISSSGTLYWTLEAVSGTVNNQDFSSPASAVSSGGSVTITNGSGSFSVTLNNDASTEGAETFRARLRTGSTSGTIVATSSTVTINDTSVTTTTTAAPFPNISNVIAYGAGPGQTWTQTQAYVTWGGSAWGSYTVIASNGSSSNSPNSGGGPPVLLSGFSAGTTYSVTVTLYANANYTGNTASGSTSFTTAAATTTTTAAPTTTTTTTTTTAAPTTTTTTTTTAAPTTTTTTTTTAATTTTTAGNVCAACPQYSASSNACAQCTNCVVNLGGYWDGSQCLL